MTPTLSPSVSVVLPVYRAAAFLRRAWESVRAQPEVAEILLVEDGSPDGSLAICEELVREDPRSVLLRHPGGLNRGAGASRNLGIERASSRYLAFLDADDYYLPARFARDVAILENDATVDGVYGVLGTTHGRDLDSSMSGEVTRIRGVVPPEELFESMAPLASGGHFHIDTLTVRRESLRRIGPFNTSLELSQDTELFIRMAAVLRLVGNGLDEPVAVRRVHGGNRISDRAKLMRLRSPMFRSALSWARRARVGKARRFHLWRVWHYHAFLPEAGPRRSAWAFACESLRADPTLLWRRKFWRTLFPRGRDHSGG